MNRTRTKLSVAINATLSLAAASSGGFLYAQQGDDLEEVFELSPFTVDSSGDSGYRATTTLAGSRLNMQLEDVGSAISVMTKEFMDDTGATSAETLLSYGLSTEVGGDQGNFSNITFERDNRVASTSARTNTTSNNRVRGLDSATTTRDYFLTSIPFDSYNTESVTVSRGANSLLFGVGTPGGIIENTLSQASTSENFGKFGLRMGLRGSWRSTLDYNKVLIQDRLAVRFSLLESETNFQQSPAFDEDSRQFLAFKATLLKNEGSEWLGATNIRGSFENGEKGGTPVNVLPALDGVTSYLQLPDNYDEIWALTGQDPQPYEENFTPGWGVDPLDPNDNPAQGPYRSPFWDAFYVAYGDAGNLDAGIGLPSDPSVDGLHGRHKWTGDYSDWGTVWWYQTDSGYGEPAYPRGFSPQSIVDTSIYDNRDVLLAGNSNFVNHDFDVLNARLEQTFFDNKAGIEIAYNKEDYTRDAFLPFNRNQELLLTIDVNERLGSGEPNPNLGRPFIFDGGTSSRGINNTLREAYQATAFYKLDFSQSDNWTKALGSHTFTGFLGSQQMDFDNRTLRTILTDPNDPNGQIPQLKRLGTHPGDFGRAGNAIVYVGPSVYGSTSVSDIMVDSYFSGTRPIIPGQTYTIKHQKDAQGNYMPGLTDTNRFWTSDFLAREFVTGGGRSRRTIDSEVISVQSNWFDGHVVSVLGWRGDEQTDTSRISQNAYREINNGQGFRLPGTLEQDPNSFILGDDTQAEEGDTATASVVAHIPEEWLKLPLNTRVSAHYSESENFSVQGIRRNVYGEVLPSPTGTTTDYGFTVTTLDDRLVMRFNWFETESQFAAGGVSPIRVPGWPATELNWFRQAELNGMTWEEVMVKNETQRPEFGDLRAYFPDGYQSYYQMLIEAVPEPVRSRYEGFLGNDGSLDPVAGKPSWGPNPNQSAIRNTISKGLEIDVSGRITDNWTIAFNAARAEAIADGSIPAYAEFASQLYANLLNSPLSMLADEPQTFNQSETHTERMARVTLPPIIAAQLQDGTPLAEVRKWRWNLVSKYRFDDGALEGFEVGGAIRWQGKMQSGTEIEMVSGIPQPLLDRPFYGPSETNGDLFIRYTRPLGDKIDWTLQLNARNLYRSNSDFIPIRTNPDGRHSFYRNPNPKDFYLTSSFEF